MNEPIFTSGPPGTGKTFIELRKRYKEFVKKYKWNEIVVLSHTNVAAMEIIKAVKTLPQLQGVTIEDLEDQICTIHSYCRSMYVKMSKWEKEDHNKFASKFPIMKKWKKKWDKHPLYQFCSQAHGREMTSEQYAKVCDPKSFEPYSVKMLKNLKEEYDKFRKTPGQERLSFEDMIDNFLFYGKEPEDIQVLMVDEAQDCSRPQIKALHKLATNITDPEGYRFIGDADQTLYQYAGADPEYFHMLALKHKDNELKNGLRCCETINTICKNIIAPVWKKWGYTRKWLPAGGKIGEHNFISRIDKPCPGSFKLLQKIKSTLETFLFVYRGVPSDDVIKTFFYKHGIDFSHVGSDPHISRKVFRCFNTWNQFLTDKVSLQQIKEYWPLMGVRGENGVKVNKMGDVKNLESLINKDYNIQEIIDLNLLKPNVLQYKNFSEVVTDIKILPKIPFIKKVLLNNFDVEKMPRVEYGNIHQVKGLTRNNIVVDLTVTRREDFYEGRRLGYVAYSRGEYDCWTILSRTNMSLGGIEANKKEIFNKGFNEEDFHNFIMRQEREVYGRT